MDQRPASEFPLPHKRFEQQCYGMSRKFLEVSAAKLWEFQERDLSDLDVVVLFLDGKTFADDEMVIALGVVEGGEKQFLGSVQTETETETENEPVVSQLSRSLVDRGLDTSSGLLVVVDGSKGFLSAIHKVFRKRAVIQRCQWHKRENVVSHLPKKEQSYWRRRLQRSYQRPTYDEALTALRLNSQCTLAFCRSRNPGRVGKAEHSREN